MLDRGFILKKRLLVREAVLGLTHGIWLGLPVAGIALAWKQYPSLGLVLGVADAGQHGHCRLRWRCNTSLRRIGVDPAVAGVVVTTFTDVFVFLLFLGIASAAIDFIQ